MGSFDNGCTQKGTYHRKEVFLEVPAVNLLFCTVSLKTNCSLESFQSVNNLKFGTIIKVIKCL